MNTRENQALKARAHSLKPVVFLGAKALTPAVIAETNEALKAHELIKVKIMKQPREEKNETARLLAEAVSAHLVQIIGNIVILYREREEE